jgi:chromosome segregation ATPase
LYFFEDIEHAKFRKKNIRLIYLQSMEPTNEGNSVEGGSGNDAQKLMSELETTRAELNSVKSQLESTQADLNSMKNEKDNAISETSQTIQELEKLREESATLRRLLEESKAEISQLNAQIESKDGEMKGLEDNFNSTKSQLESITAENLTAISEINSLKSKSSQLETEITGMKARSADVNALQEEIKVLKILASTQSQALDMYNILKKYQSLNMRKLAMQAGMAAATCQNLLVGMESAGLVKIERTGPDDTDPKITLVGG